MWLKRRKELNIYEEEKPQINWRKGLYILLSTVALLVIVTSLLFLLGRKELSDIERGFVTALGQKQYSLAMKRYHAVQMGATDLSLSDDERARKKLLQDQMESDAFKLIDQISESVLSGAELSADEEDLLEGLAELSAARILPLLREKSEELLDGKLSPERWEALLSTFSKPSNLRSVTDGLLEQKDCLCASITVFAEAADIEKGGDWQLAWSSWQKISDNKENCRFVREYAGYHLRAYQEREYSHLLDLAGKMVEASRYVSGYDLLSRMQKVFPGRQEIDNLLKICEKNKPSSIESWKGEVEVLSVFPLTVQKELAFASAEDPGYALNNLLTADEFKKMLDQLREKNYILISPREVQAWPNAEVELRVPSGKKPLMLIFDQWSYSALNQLCGTAAQLFIDKEGHLSARAGLKTGPELDAIPILDSYLLEYPDFSFDGAKALIALRTDESILGYVCNESQMKASQKAWEKFAQEYPELDKAGLDKQKSELLKVLTLLKTEGWDFASVGDRGLDTGTLSHEELSSELAGWRESTVPLGIESYSFVFPNGSNVYTDAESLNKVLDSGFHVFFGEGPKPYYFFEKKFVHFDRTMVSGNTLTTPSWKLERILDPQAILDMSLRR